MSDVPNSVDLSNSPVSLDTETLNQLFPAEAPQAQAQLAPPAGTPAATPPAPTVTTPPAPQEPYLKGDGSVYNTREAAVNGLNEKDRLIQQLRQQYSLATGVDPITKQPLQQQRPNGAENYLENPDKYLKDLGNAKTAQDLTRVQTKLVLDTLQPLQPLITSSARNQAVASMKTQYQDFDKFYGGQEYTQVLEQTPSLKEAIEISENDYRFHNRLPDLYRTAYLVHNGMRLPQVLSEQANKQPPPQTPRQMPATTPDLGEPVMTQAGLSTSEQRKALIKQFESQSGFGTKVW